MRDRPRSKGLYDRAKVLMPGGVSSPVRAFQPYPCYIEKGKGSKIIDVDGIEYIDYCMGFGPLILGHAHPKVITALKEQADAGTLYGAPIEKEVQFIEMLRRYYPSIKMARIVNTGTEATMHGIRTARGFTGRKKIVKIEGAFHGAHDCVLVKAGSGATTHCSPNSLGVPEEVTANTLLAPFNDAHAIEDLLRANRGEVAAIIMEPVIGNAGPILPEEGYLRQVREITAKNDVLLIFDEVITGFRLSMGGAQGYYGVVPDITILGKIAGGGMPIGVFGASEEIMSMVSPIGKVYQAGTFSGNPMSLTAGLTTIAELERVGHDGLSMKGERLRKGLTAVLSELHLDYTVQGIGSMYQMFLTEGRVKDYKDACTSDTKTFMRLFHSLLDRGIYMPPSQFETDFISTAHTDADIDQTIDAFSESLGELM